MNKISQNGGLVFPLITVITPVYNSEYFYDSIISVLEQSYENIQYIIIDDGSIQFDEAAVKVFIETHKKSNLQDYQVIKNKMNKGTVKTLNIGLAVAAGEYIFNLAADDVFYDQEVLKAWVREFILRKAQVITGVRAVYDTDLTGLIEMLPAAADRKLLLLKRPEKVFERLVKSNFILGCCTAVHRMVFEQYGCYDEDYALVEDYPLMLKLSRKGVLIEFWNRPVIKYRLGGVSAPEKFNTKYERDSDLILEKEILPFLNDPQLARRSYRKWKYAHKEYGKFIGSYQRFKSKKLFYLIPFLCLRYPVPALRYIKYKWINK